MGREQNIGEYFEFFEAITGARKQANIENSWTRSPMPKLSFTTEEILAVRGQMGNGDTITLTRNPL